MTKIKNNTARVISAEGVRLLPGWNQVENDELAQRCLANPGIKRQVDAKEIEVGGTSASGGGTSDLSKLNADDAVAEIRETFDVQRLRDLRKGEKRKTVLDAIDHQLDTIEKQAKKDAAAGK